MMEGISSEAASLAGHLGLSNLCWIYDNNRITIEGATSLAFSDDVATRFIGYGWNVTRVGDANDRTMLARAFETFKKESERPTLIIVDSHIAYGSPTKQGTSSAHGEPLGEEEVRAHEARLRLARGRAVPRPRRRARALRRRHRRARAQAARGVDGALRALPGRAPRARRPPAADAAARAARRLGRRHPRVPARREGHRRARGVGQGAQRDRQEPPVAARAARPTSRRRRRRS